MNSLMTENEKISSRMMVVSNVDIPLVTRDTDLEKQQDGSA